MRRVVVVPWLSTNEAVVTRDVVYLAPGADPDVLLVRVRKAAGRLRLKASKKRQV